MSGSDPNRSMVPPTKSMTRSRGRRRARARGRVHDPITEQATTIQPVANERQARGEATEHAIEPHIPVFDKSVRMIRAIPIASLRSLLLICILSTASWRASIQITGRPSRLMTELKNGRRRSAAGRARAECERISAREKS